MDPYRNPFAPGAGSRPPELAGRDLVLEQARIASGRAIFGRHARSIILLGLRGTGKTVLLNEIEGIGRQAGLLTSKIESPEDKGLAQLLVPEMRRVMRSLSVAESAKDLADRGLRALRSFVSIFKIEVAGFEVEVDGEPGLADSGDLQADLPDLFLTIGQAAKAADKGWMLLIDEIQYLSEPDLSALIVAVHKVSQAGLPVLFVGAGLPQVARLAGDAKSYAERLFVYPEVGPLDRVSAEKAIRNPIREEGADISDDALAEIVTLTKGYPFFLQEWASILWDSAQGPTITLAETQKAYRGAIASLDEGFFKVRIDRLTKAEVKFVQAMAALGDGPYSMADIAKEMGRQMNSLGPARATIIHKGMIYSPSFGYLDFTVPLFADFIRRRFS